MGCQALETGRGGQCQDVGAFGAPRTAPSSGWQVSLPHPAWAAVWGVPKPLKWAGEGEGLSGAANTLETPPRPQLFSLSSTFLPSLLLPQLLGTRKPWGGAATGSVHTTASLNVTRILAVQVGLKLKGPCSPLLSSLPASQALAVPHHHHHPAGSSHQPWELGGRAEAAGRRLGSKGRPASEPSDGTFLQGAWLKETSF